VVRIAARASSRDDDVDVRRPQIAERGPVVTPLLFVKHRVQLAQRGGGRPDVVGEDDEIDIGRFEARHRRAARDDDLGAGDAGGDAPTVLQEDFEGKKEDLLVERQDFASSDAFGAAEDELRD